MPMFFQTVLLDTVSLAGLRLVPPSLATPLGGLGAGIFMLHCTNLTLLTRTGLLLCFLGILLTLTLGTQDPGWKYSVFLIFGNFGQGITYPSLLFGCIRASEKEGKYSQRNIELKADSLGRPCRCDISRIFDAIYGYGLGCGDRFNHGAEPASRETGGSAY